MAVGAPSRALRRRINAPMAVLLDMIITGNESFSKLFGAFFSTLLGYDAQNERRRLRIDFGLTRQVTPVPAFIEYIKYRGKFHLKQPGK
jgi:hypothetical protein